MYDCGEHVYRNNQKTKEMLIPRQEKTRQDKGRQDMTRQDKRSEENRRHRGKHVDMLDKSQHDTIENRGQQARITNTL